MEIERFDERTAAFYEWLVKLRVFDWAYSAAAKAVAKVAKPGRCVLEIGPGTGALMRRLEAAGYRVVGVDISPPMLKYAKRRAGDPLAGASFALPLRGGRLRRRRRPLHATPLGPPRPLRGRGKESPQAWGLLRGHRGGQGEDAPGG